jgi:hypothetical protein
MKGTARQQGESNRCGKRLEALQHGVGTKEEAADRDDCRVAARGGG